MITLLIDSHGLGYRSFHSTGNLSNGIAFGFLTTVLQLSEKYHTNQFVFCWDGPGSLRKKLFPAYKQSRDTKTPEEWAERKKIHTQFDALRTEILPALGFQNQFIQYGYEADDLVAHIVVQNPDDLFIVVSSDHDLFQLLRYHNCKAQHQLSGKPMTASKFMAEYRVPAREWPTVKAIAGCDGDGVIGIPGVGEKTAIKYLLDELPDGKKKRLIEDKQLSGPTIRRNHQLVHLPFPGVLLLKIKRDSFNEKTVLQVFGDLSFESFLADKQADRWVRFCRGQFV